MNTANQKEDKNIHSLNRNRVARAVFTAAESMGMSDRRLIERLAARVIERLEQKQPLSSPPTLPGMEDMVARSPRRQAPLPTDIDIQAMVEEILVAEELKHAEEARAKMGEIDTVKIKVQPASGVKLTENARHVLQKRYLKKDKQGQVIETPEEMFRRVAQAIASAELNYDSKADVKKTEEVFYQLMTNLEFLPNSPTLMNAGRELGQLSACFVLPIEDSMESIFNAVKYTALIHKSGGGDWFFLL